MAVAQYGNSGIYVGYDPTVYESVKNQLKTLLPGEGANWGDYALLIAAFQFTNGTPYELLRTRGATIMFDGTTNLISSSGSEVKVWFRAFTSAGVACAIGEGVGHAPVPGSKIAGFFLGNAASSWYLDNIFDPLFGVVLTKYKNIDTTKPAPIYQTDSNLEHTLNDFWTNSDPEFNLSLLRDQLPSFDLVTSDTPKITFIKVDNSYTIQFESQPVEENFREVLRHLSVGDLPTIKFGNAKYILEANYYAEHLSLYTLKSDNKALYGALKLKPYILNTDESQYNSLNSHDYNDEMLENRLRMFEISRMKTDAQREYQAYRDGALYKDVETGIEFGDSSASVIGFANGGSTLYGGARNDKLFSMGSATIHGGGGYDRIFGGIANDTLYGDGGNDYIEGGLGDDNIDGGAGNDTIFTNANIQIQYDEESALNQNFVHAGDGNDRVYGSNAEDHIHGEAGNDVLFGYGGIDMIYGGDGDDSIAGGLGMDLLYGGAGNDTLVGNNGYGSPDTEADRFEGGSGFDTYVAGNGDTIKDSDGKGLAVFDGIDLTGRKNKNKQTGRYEDNDYIYDGNPNGTGTLTVTSKNGSKSITIQEWSNKDLGIELTDNKDIDVSITPSASASEGDSGKRSLYFTVTLSRALEDGESLKVSVSSTDEGSYTFTSGEQSKTFTHSWYGDTVDEGAIDHVATLTPTASYSGPSDDVKVTIKNSGTATVYDDDEEPRHDPLALDMNMDGFISTTALETSGTYFDITGDGLRERVGWVSSEDALLAYDKNENGQIDGIDEVFGNLSESGFEELKRLVDSNHDGKIDRRDELFQQLKVWNDFNQDAMVQDGELRSLSEAGITSIDLNYVSTNIEINGNLLVEASKYTTTLGNKELAADIQLATDAKDTKVDINDIPNFNIDPITNLLPQLRGSGLVYDSFIRYNIDPEFKAIALEMSTNLQEVATDFDTFIEHYSGYTAYVNQLREKYSQSTFEMVEADKRAWIVEHFEATNQYTSDIEAYYNTNLNNGKIPTTAKTADTTMEIKYRSLADQLESTFAMQSIFQSEFSSTHYDLATQTFIVDDTSDLQNKITDYFNSDVKTIDEKLYLAKVMQLQQSGLDYDIDTIVGGINNDITQELVRYVYTGSEATLFEIRDTYTTDGIIVASDADELITTSDANNKILLNGGDDQLISGKGNNTFYFRKGDGSDTIFDKGGVDSLVFDEGITRDSVEIRLNRNSDLIIALKEDGKTFDELSDKVTIVDWMKPANRVDVIAFGDGSTLKFQDVFDLFEATDGVEVIQLSSGNDIIDAKGGNDVIQALGGNDTLIGGKGDDRLEGGLGNDTYIYGRGDGKDTIIDTGDHDTLQFAEGITIDDLIVQYKGSDLMIGLKEEGKTFEQLSDVVTLKNYKNAQNTIEAIYLDGYQIVDIDELLNAPTEFDDILTLSNNDQNIDLLAGNDTVSTGEGNDAVSGNSGDDTIKTNGGNDVLAGNSGNDTLEGGLGDDTYLFNRGDGKDTIYDDYSYGHDNIQKDNAGNDTLQFGEGITAEDIVTKYFGQDLLIGIKEGDKPFEELSDVVTIKNYLDENNRIEHIVLSDGNEVAIDTKTQFGTEGMDKIHLENATDSITIQALGSPDFVYTGSGDDTIDGGGSADDLYGGAGDDILVGGSESDFLAGGSGDDIYVYNRGDSGEQGDIIFDDNRPGSDDSRAGTQYYMWQSVLKMKSSSTPQTDGGNDTLQFGEGISANDIFFSRGGPGPTHAESSKFYPGDDTLIVTIADGGGKIIILEYFNQYNTIENFLLADGTSVEVPVLETPVVTATPTPVPPTMGNDTYTFNSADAPLTIIDQGGSDTLVFGEGITQESIIGKQVGYDFIIALKEDGKTFDELTNKVIIKNYNNINNRVETIVFSDGTHIETESLKVATDGDDVLTFGDESKTIDGLAGNDILTTGSGNDTLIGGKGNDTLNGGAGNDLYIFNRGDGKDTITYSYGNDTLKFGDGIGVDELEARFVGSDLVIAIKESGVAFDALSDKVTIQYNSIDNITLSDGIKVSLSSILTRPTNNDDNLNFSSLHEAIIIDGLAGNDTLTMGSGNDTLIGGAGNDTLNGGAGNDLYIFNRGDGKDTITYSYGNDTLKFGDGIGADDLEVRFVGFDLVVAIKESGVIFDALSDKITIQSNFIKNITLSDGTKLSLDDMWSQPTQGDDILDYTYTNVAITVDGLAGNDTVTTGSGDDTIYGGAGNDTISSGAGSDTIDGGSGNDKLYGGLGNDTIIGGTGEDVLNGGEGNDIYRFNRGDGKDTLNDSAGNDAIVFGAGITVDDVRFEQDNFDLRIALNESNKTFDELSDVIFIKDWFKTNTNIETIKFADGSTLSATQIATILMSSEPDTLYSNHGAVMLGGFGDDTYVYKKDDFTVIIDDQFTNKEIAINAGDDTLKFEDINKEQVTIGTKGNDLVIKIEATHDTYTELKDYVLIRDWKNPNRGIEQIEFGNGEVLTIDKTASYPELEFDENWIKGHYYIYGSEDNVINGSSVSEVIESGAGDDIVHALDGNDTINGGLGNDTLDGGKGNDTYVFNRGDGSDIIYDYEGGVDSVKFGSGIALSDILLERVNDDLVMALKVDGKTFEELSDKITLSDWFNEDTLDHRIELMVLDNEGTFAIADRVILPTINNDDLEYGDENNHIDALAGDDIIHIGGGDDVLAGNDGNDTLYGEAGNDTISGDKGDDTLYGADGNDTYLFGRGDGKDVIIEDDFANWSQTGNDTLKFKEGITQNDLILVEEGDDLIVALKETGKTFDELSDKITLKNWSLYDEVNSRDLSRAYYTVENFSFSDGSIWNMSEIISHIGTDEGEIVHGFNSNDTLNAQVGNDTLYGYLGDDTYIFNRGDGHDTIFDYGRKGDDYSYYDAGNDTLKFGAGIGKDDLIAATVEENDDLIIYLKEDGKTLLELSDTIVLKDWFKVNNRVENILLNDGTLIDLVDYLHAEPTEGDDKLIYGNEDDSVDALNGNDVVFAQGGDDIVWGNGGDDDLQGGSGNDTLIGGEGNDTLNGGSGDDRLEGDSGNDIYTFNLGDGHDVISDYTLVQGESDSIRFGVDIVSDNMTFIRRGNDLTITIDDANSVKVENWFAEDGYRIEALQFSDGTLLDVNDVENRVLYYGDEYDNVMSGSNNSSKIYGFEGNDTIQSNAGNDILYGGAGNDTYIFNSGDGHDTIDDANEGTQEINRIVFGDGIVYEDINQVIEGDDMVLGINAENSIRIVNWNHYHNITQLQFSNGVSATFGNETDNTFVSTIGSDYIFGDGGNDTYLFDRGSARDTLVDTSGLDTIAFAAGISVSDLFVKEEGDNYLIALYEEGKDFDTFSDVLTIDKSQIEKIVFDDGSGLNIADIRLHNTVADEILEGDGLVSVYEGTLSEDALSAPHRFNIVADSILSDMANITDLNVILLDAATGTYKVDGNFNVLREGEEAVVTFKYEAHYDSNDLSLVSGIKEMTLIVTGTNDIPEVTGTFSGEATEGDVIEVTGLITVADADSEESEVIAQKDVAGAYGTFSITSEGNWTYAMTSHALDEGESAIERFLVTTKDGSVEKEVLVTVNGTESNSAPVVVPLMVQQEQQVNSYTEGSQEALQIATLNGFGYVVMWQSYDYYNNYGKEGPGYGVFLQQFNLNGEKIGEEQQVHSLNNTTSPYITALKNGSYVVSWGYANSSIFLQQYSIRGGEIGAIQQVNSSTEFYQAYPEITALTDGGYVVTWRSNNQDSLGDGVFLQQFNSFGEKVGIEQQVNTYTNDDQGCPRIAVLNDGGYVVTWLFDDHSGAGYGVYLQQFNSSGEKVGAEQYVSNIKYYEGPSQITALTDGGYVLTWLFYDQDISSYSVNLQQFNSSGEKVGTEQQVNSSAAFSIAYREIAVLNDGGYVVIWESDDSSHFYGGSETGLSSEIYLQQFNAQGEKVGEEQHVNTYTQDSQSNPHITTLNNGNYVVTWTSYGQDGSEGGIYLQQFSSSGEKVGGEQQVNSYTENNQYSPVITALNDGGYTVAWTSYGQDGSESGIYLQQYNDKGEKVGTPVDHETEFSLYSTETINGNLDYIQDPDGDVLSYSASAINGIFSIDDAGHWSYNPNDDFSGEESVVIEVSDGNGGILEHTLTFNVQYDYYGGGQTIIGGEGDDILVGGSGNDTLYGEYFDNEIYYGEGNDTLIGGAGDDMLYGGNGNDTYVFNRGDGQDTIYDEGSYYDYYGDENGGPQDRIEFGEGINPYDLIVQVDDANNLIIGLREEGVSFDDLVDKITIQNYFLSQNRIETFSFADGSVIFSNEILSYLSNVNFGGSVDIIFGGSGDDIIYGGSGDDIIYAGNGNDTVYDYYGGNNIYVGGKGNDTLRGGDGNDTYIFKRGDGQDNIYDVGSWWPGTTKTLGDIVQFSEGISIDDIKVELIRDSLIITVDNSMFEMDDDIITVNFGGYEDHTIETIMLDNGDFYNISDYFGLSLTPGTYPTPIVLDLNGDGVTSVDLENSNAYFDYDGDGNREHTAWAQKGDAMLVVDLNQDGSINDGSEHFGNYTKLPDGTRAKNGYEALAQYDTNGDRIIDRRDEAFGNLLLWQDSNQNAKSEEGELTNIQVSGITAIYLDNENGITFEQSSENGNIILNETNYVSKNGTGIMRDVGFAFDPFDTITDNDTLSVAQYGTTLSGGSGNDTYVYNFGDGKIVINDNGDGADTIVFDSRIAKDQLVVKWESGSNDLLIGIKDSIYDNRAFSSLDNQIRIKNFFDESGSIEKIQLSGSTSLSKSDLYDILVNTRDTKNLTARTLYTDGELSGGSFNDLLYGTDGQEELQGLDGNDYLKGLDGDDLLIGGEGDDTLQGGLGDDTLEGDGGDDVYLYNKGDGRDMIIDFSGNDTIMFGEGITYEDVSFEINGNDLLLRFSYDLDLPIKDRDSIQITNYNDHGFEIENLEFSNGEVFSIAALIQVNTNQTPEAPSVVSNILQDIRILTGEVGATDADGDILSYTVSTEASHGVLSVDENGTWNYAAADGYMGTDSAVLTINDNNGGVITQTLNFEVNVSAPTLSDSTIDLLEDIQTSGVFNVLNPIGGALVYEILNTSSKGSFTVNETGEWNYTPNSNLNGDDSVTIKVTNAYGLSTTATLSLAIEAVNDAPILTETPLPITLSAGTSATGVIKASDVDGDTLAYSVTAAPEHGILSVNNNGTWNYTAERYYAGESSATVTIDDGHGESITTTLNFTNLMTPDWHYTYGGETLTINDSDGIDALLMNTTSMADLTFLQEGNNLRIDVKDKNDVILTDYFTSPTKGVESIQTAEGNINLAKDKIGTRGSLFSIGWGSNNGDLLVGNNNTNVLFGSAGNDIIFGNGGNDTLYGLSGNDLLIGGEGNDNLLGGIGDDIIYGDNGNDTLKGDEGNDKLFGGKGNDTLLGGNGNDLLAGGEGTNTLNGGSGNDTYLVNKGINNTTIDESIFGFSLFGRWVGQDGGNDTVKFGEGITKEDISFLMKGNDLLLQYGDNEFITINNQKSEGNKIEKLELSDGSYLSNTDIDQIIQQLSAYSKDHGFYLNNNTQIQNNQAMMNIVAAGWHQ
ncbi:calcium-binding protein [Sulfuricurvum sp.]|uniref:calcium-binding protein n=1 Tax=Sulfuricurvum sp. TaxID=2025608 RepID=UPI002632BE35|nr:calcium-binding protein [Sulfuricurvum sp.]MDD3595660.1 calcium-binding protein [Sulfuricurvum sp.]